MTTSQITKQICIVSRAGVCILDLKQVSEKAKELGLSQLAELAEREQKDSNGGEYYKAMKTLYGVTS